MDREGGATVSGSSSKWVGEPDYERYGLTLAEARNKGTAWSRVKNLKSASVCHRMSCREASEKV